MTQQLLTIDLFRSSIVLSRLCVCRSALILSRFSPFVGLQFSYFLTTMLFSDALLLPLLAMLEMKLGALGMLGVSVFRRHDGMPIRSNLSREGFLLAHGSS